MRKFEAECIERGWLRRRADGGIETTDTGEAELFQRIAELASQVRH